MFTSGITGHFAIIIVGAGFSGIGAAIRLKQEGLGPFVVLERSPEVGGVWRDNTYPGCGCDVQSHLYSFSFAPNPRWSRTYSPQAEILEYLRGCVQKFGLEPHLRLGVEVCGARWIEAERLWQVETHAGHLTCNILIAGVGGLNEPSIPSLPGLEQFGGPTFHTARWRHDVELKAKRVAVIGTGASAIQLIPEIQPLVQRLVVYQRTPPWILPRDNPPIHPRAKAIYDHFPLAQRLVRSGIYAIREAMWLAFREGMVMRANEKMARQYLAKVISDPALREKLTPRYHIGCKRILLSDTYLPTLMQDNVEVITEPISHIRGDKIVASNHIEREVDVVILATGYKVWNHPLAQLVTGQGGIKLAEVWGQSPKAHLGTMVAGFPNLFLLIGPNTGLGHTSVMIMAEVQIRYLLLALKYLREHHYRDLVPRDDAMAAYVHDVDKSMSGSVWTAGGCASWYLDPTGRNSTLWPGPTFTYARRLAVFQPAEYHFSPEPSVTNNFHSDH